MAALAPGSISLRLYPHNELEAPAIIDELLAQAALADSLGFDGVMTSEHHGGFAGYLPNPLQVAGWALEVMRRAWAAPCPLLLTLRPPALVAEETAWLAARFPDRVGLGVAAGALADDFAVMGLTTDRLGERFATGLAEVVALLDGTVPGALEGDRAVRRCRDHPIPVVSAAMGLTASRRAARCGAGLLFDSMSSPERCRQLTDAYRGAGGHGPCLLIRRAWLGEPPRASLARQLDVYRGYASTDTQAHWRADELVTSPDPETVAAGLVDVLDRAGADALNLRIHAPGVTPAEVREQIVALGQEVLPSLRAALARLPRAPRHGCLPSGAREDHRAGH
jgi:alkanesulfonate monooxygenase SsuD/methylene tetrahydromethanopterin reductase-like flavin-dependent oxidoreductase (luciferase family)